MKRVRNIIIGIILIVALLSILYFTTIQSVFSIGKISTSVEGGKVYWTVFASASNINEQYDFVKKFGKYEYDDGSGKTVTPQQSLAILITEQDSSCRYSIIDLGDGIKGLSNPSKEINLLVLDANSGQSQILEGERADSVTINDPDGKGKLIVTSEGILERESRCPDYENVAIVDGQPYFRDEVLQQREDCRLIGGNILNCLLGEKPKINNQFTSAFETLEYTSSEVIGRGLDLGEATFTIKADEDYFESVVYTPPKDCKPVITSISSPDEIQEGSSSSIKVNLKNNADASCKVTISVSSPNDISFSPKSKEVTLDNTASVSFTLSNGNDIGSKRINVEACFVGFTGEICDSNSQFFDSTENKPNEFCGDNICQASESETQCPIDCLQEDNGDTSTNVQEQCLAKAEAQPLLGWTYVEETKQPGLLKEIFTLGFAKPKVEARCEASFVKYWFWSIFGLIVFVTLLIYGNKKLKLFVGKKKRK